MSRPSIDKYDASRRKNYYPLVFFGTALLLVLSAVAAGLSSPRAEFVAWILVPLAILSAIAGFVLGPSRPEK